MKADRINFESIRAITTSNLWSWGVCVCAYVLVRFLCMCILYVHVSAHVKACVSISVCVYITVCVSVCILFLCVHVYCIYQVDLSQICSKIFPKCFWDLPIMLFMLPIILVLCFNINKINWCKFLLLKCSIRICTIRE